MIIPACDEILSLSGEYNIIPICREIYADVVTPITLLRRIAERSSRFYLLESIEGGEKWGRYSFLGYNPVMRVACRCGKVKIESHVSRFPSREIQTDHIGTVQVAPAERAAALYRWICGVFCICND